MVLSKRIQGHSQLTSLRGKLSMDYYVLVPLPIENPCIRYCIELNFSALIKE